MDQQRVESILEPEAVDHDQPELPGDGGSDPPAAPGVADDLREVGDQDAQPDLGDSEGRGARVTEDKATSETHALNIGRGVSNDSRCLSNTIGTAGRAESEGIVEATYIKGRQLSAAAMMEYSATRPSAACSVGHARTGFY